MQGFYSDGSDLLAYSSDREFVYLNAGEYDQAGFYLGYLWTPTINYGCISPHTIDAGICCAGRGVSLFSGQTPQIYSDIIRPTYRDISSKTALHAALYEDMYVIINPNGNSIVFQQYRDSVRAWQWSFASTARCVAVDKRANVLYIGTDTGIYKYDPTVHKDSEGAISVTAYMKEFEYAPETEDLGIERYMVLCNTGSNSLNWDMYIDQISRATGTFSNSSKTEEEGFTSLGAQGSFVQPRFTATVSSGSPIKIYRVEVS